MISSPTTQLSSIRPPLPSSPTLAVPGSPASPTASSRLTPTVSLSAPLLPRPHTSSPPPPRLLPPSPMPQRPRSPSRAPRTLRVRVFGTAVATSALGLLLPTTLSLSRTRRVHNSLSSIRHCHQTPGPSAPSPTPSISPPPPTAPPPPPPPSRSTRTAQPPSAIISPSAVRSR